MRLMSRPLSSTTASFARKSRFACAALVMGALFVFAPVAVALSYKTGIYQNGAGYQVNVHPGSFTIVKWEAFGFQQNGLGCPLYVLGIRGNKDTVSGTIYSNRTISGKRRFSSIEVVTVAGHIKGNRMTLTFTMQYFARTDQGQTVFCHGKVTRNLETISGGSAGGNGGSGR
jgi:hypothetical protein